MSYDLRRRGGIAPAARFAARPASKAALALAAVLGALGILAALAAVGCGKEGPPTPPLRAVPAPTKDLVVRQRGTHVLLSFTYPQTTPGGRALNGVSKVEVYEAIVPPPAPPKPAKPSKKGTLSAAAADKGAATTAAGKGATATTTTATAAAAATPGAAAGSSVATAAAAPGTATAEAAGAAAGSAPAGSTPAETSGAAAGTSTATTPGAAAGTATGTPGSAAGAPGATAPGKAAGTPGGPAGAASEEEQALDPRIFEHLAKVRLTLTGKELGAATLGNQLIVDLTLPEPLPATTDKGATREYAVRSYGPQGDRSGFSNQVRLLPKTPPQPPAAVTVAPQADGILVEWKPVTGAGGYAVYRRAATERFSSKPLAVIKAPATRHLDQSARFGQSYIYSVTAVDAKQPLIESAIKSEQEIHYVDRYPPPVPEELVVVTEAGRARLVWRPSEAPDLAGYIVYRKGASGDFVRLTAKPILATSYVDATVVSGQAYDYRVTAIDQTGNESAPGEVHAAVP
jgi:hypothetical protein